MSPEGRLNYFLTEVARGTVQEFMEAPADLRRGVLAAIVVNQLVEFIHEGRPDLLVLHERIAPHDKRHAKGEKLKAFRKRLADKDRCPDLPLLRDVADATKHPTLGRVDPKPEIPGIEAVRPQHPTICGRDGEPTLDRSGDPSLGRLAVLVDAPSGQKLLAKVVQDCMNALEAMIATAPPSS